MKGNLTRQRLLEVGLREISTHGFSGVTLGQVAIASGLSKSGIFAHFGSKEQLQIALLDEAARNADRVVREPALQAGEGMPRLRLVVDLWFGWPARVGLTGCPLAAALFELDDIEGSVRSHVVMHEEQWRTFLETLVREAMVGGSLSADTDVEQFVWELCAIYLGHHASSRFLHDKNANARARIAFEALIHRNKAVAACMDSIGDV